MQFYLSSSIPKSRIILLDFKTFKIDENDYQLMITFLMCYVFIYFIYNLFYILRALTWGFT